MAEFCNQCADALGFNPANGIQYDYANLQTEEDDKQGLGSTVLCEGCGFTLVNSKGECLMKCPENHGDIPFKAEGEIVMAKAPTISLDEIKYIFSLPTTAILLADWNHNLAVSSRDDSDEET